MWEAISLGLILLNVALFAYCIPQLPDIIPIHFGRGGKADGYGSKHSLWFVMCISVPVYALFTWISANPNLYKNRFTEHNIEEQKRIASKMARTLKAFVLLAFFILSLFMIQTAQGKWLRAIPFLFLVFFGLVVTPALYYAVRLSNAQTKT